MRNFISNIGEVLSDAFRWALAAVLVLALLGLLVVFGLTAIIILFAAGAVAFVIGAVSEFRKKRKTKPNMTKESSCHD